jgi:hypothetical protein
MQRSLARALPLLCGAAGYLAAYFVSTALPTRLLWHLPVEHRFTYEVRPLALGADFYGRLLLCLGAGALAYGAATFAIRFFRIELRAHWLRALLFWTFGLLLFTSGMYLNILSARRPMAAPLPAGYVAR